MKINKRIFGIILIMGTVISLLPSCEKFNDWEVDDSYNRLFRPSTLTADVVGVTTTLKWKGMPKTNSYVIELSKDSLKFNSIISTYETKGTKTGNDLSFEIPGLLDPNTQYSARIKGVDKTGTTSDSEWISVAFKTKTEQILNVVMASDLTTTTAVLKWEVSPYVTHFMIGSNKYNISEQEKSEGKKIISGLTPETKYTATIYNDLIARGSREFTTLAVLPEGPNVIQVQSGDDFATMLANAIDGTTFVLFRNTVYKASDAINIPDNISITIWGQGGGNKPVLAFNGINLVRAKTIKFENIDITGYQDNDNTKPKRNYIFNLGNGNGGTVNELNFENCIIRNFVNTALRIQNSTTVSIDRLIVNNCIVTDVGNNGSNGTYAFIHVNANANAQSKISNITIANSTFSGIGYGLILHNTSASSSLTVENNTFYNTTGDGRYFIDYNTFSAGTISIKNNILAKSLSLAETARGIRISGGFTAVNTYKTNDLKFVSNATGFLDYDGSASQLFVDPSTGNFRIKDNGFAGKSTSGDPRWRIN
ncbi:hypothetical protein Pedsa_3354 [Pseudopedobacter saltans DSM 12145]|uniref:Fibronectin type-III domain-containing protein n=1 Tax=Pseudopedobacter saltans (strain ATCC 51119 / DSM 12145 / JCM 21818 / CCUG 39354 / LMG 10337 / NBRC 100064 / NCIMB 13643) TaxID=762903 RepID=F0SCP5_PSESL|nr:DUF5123 domain-containing protein [Pseudopedobacter saltans]ADY53889.1 hypothetical protein Pedsa_3354 [Pseudopedobacter saltans DSM 12145]